ncbi:MAG: ABC transporter substrate-binding protein [Verrucomicrobiaceae bacterium]|nr:ABC transporter substrate-binding protein [Verrucomicrobiaceae bacterium]
MTLKLIAIGFALLVTLSAPFLLRPGTGITAGNSDITISVITPHNESIRHEFGLAFARHMKLTRNKTVHIDWRTPGSGTADLERYLQSEYRANFEHYWRDTLHKEWSNTEVASHFDNRRLTLPENEINDSPKHAAKRAFLQSNVSCGVDVFFGGGDYPFKRFAEMGYLVDSGIFNRHPEWFSEKIIPSKFSGEIYYDTKRRWVGASLSSFGICYNPFVLQRLGVNTPPSQWMDLGEPVYFRKIAIADPTKSGSVTKALEMLVQQQMRKKVKDGNTQEIALTEGWSNGLQLIRRIGANARYFTDSATKIPFDVAQGNAAAGMCIDFYGRTYNEITKHPGRGPRIHYVTPHGGSSFSVDPIAMLRGAPNPAIAQAFIDFVISKDGQKIWAFRPQEPGGPIKKALRRLPIRKDLYSQENTPHCSDPEVRPFSDITGFEYISAWTGRHFNPLRFIVRVMCIDTHEELQKAWQALIKSGFPPRALAAFNRIDGSISYRACQKEGSLGKILGGKNSLAKARLAKALASSFRTQYAEVINLAEAGH